MSTTATKQSYAQAQASARAFKALFSGAFERWEFAGSLRRQKSAIGDIEHVVIPKMALLPAEDLFATPTPTNLIWQRAEELLADRAIERHCYGDTGFRWGPLYRGIDFRGVMHEIFTANESNWGSKLAIATGPADYSKSLVTALHRERRRNIDGAVWDCVPCDFPGGCPGKTCRLCDGKKLRPMQRLPTPTEQSFFAAAGLAYIEPEQRS